MPLVASDIQYLRDSIAKRSGNVITDGQSYLFEARLAPLVKECQLRDVHALVEELRRKPHDGMHDRITELMTINETSFFRDMQPFDALRDVVLPELLPSRAENKTLSIWSAASSSGQEAYSLAILLREHFPELHDWTTTILGTDISLEMVDRTREGVYSQFEVNRGLPSQLLLKYFHRKGLKWQATPELRAMVQCRKMNLTQVWPLAIKHDIVFLRNVLIYFDRPTKQKILQRVHQVIRPDGYLFLGGGETMIQLDAPFERVTVGQTIAFKPVH